MENIISKKHETWIDIIRGIGIALVVLVHVSSPFTRYLGGFLIQVFFLLSGYLWKDKGLSVNTLIIKNLKRSIRPYFILCGINLVIYSVILLASHREVPLINYIIGILYSRGTMEWMPNCSPLWFLTAFFVAISLFEMIMKIKQNAVRIGLIILSGAVSALLSYSGVWKLIWNIDSAMMGLVFIFIGYLAKKYNILAKFRQVRIWMQIIVLTILAVYGVLAAKLNYVDVVAFVDNTYGNVFFMLSGSLALNFVLFYLCYVINWGKIVITRILTLFGRHTVFIMGFDYLTGTISESVLNGIGFNNWGSLYVVKLILLFFGCLLWERLLKLIRSEKVRTVLTF